MSSSTEKSTRSWSQRLEDMLGLEGLGQAENALACRAAMVIATLAVAVRLLFWIYTQRYWEDALITCLHSENFVRGLGLSHFRPGEPPLHGFTSPLSVLVPLIGDLIHVGFGVDFLKLVSLPASALTVFYLCAIGIHPKVRFPLPLTVMVMGYAAFEHHQILWGMAGMETQLSTLILVMSVYYSLAWRPVALGVSLGLCMLVRPDYGFWCVVVGIYALFRERKQLWKIVAVSFAVYGPWLIFTTLYYGSPLPNTIVAKGLGYASWVERAGGVSFFTIKRQIWMTMSEQLHVMLGPTFCGHGAGIHRFLIAGSESPIGNLMFFFAVIGSLVILIRRQWPLWPLLACTVVYSLYYIFCVPVIFGWYKVPYLLLLLLLSARGLQAVSSLLPKVEFRRGLLWGFAVAYLALFVGVLPLTFYTERQIQRDIENSVRKQAGLYLAEHMKADEAVGCEPLGYMGYYSRGNVYDWPGLNSRAVVAWSKANPDKRCLEEMLKGLQPEYLFLRDLEMRYWFGNPDWFRTRYHVVKVFAVDPEKAKKIRWLDRNTDTSFRIYKKNRPEDAPYDDSIWPPPPEGHSSDTSRASAFQ
jgi:hypothetical protein